MIALVQRVTKASVSVDGKVVGAIGDGMLILLGVHNHDSSRELDWLVSKCAQLRIFPDDDGRMNRSLEEVKGDALVVSQFTLYANTAKGNRPSYIESAPADISEPLYNQFIRALSSRLGRPVPAGVFGAMMDVELVNSGPVTIWLEKAPENEVAT